MVEPREKTDVPIVSQSKSMVAILLILISLVLLQSAGGPELGQFFR